MLYVGDSSRIMVPQCKRRMHGHSCDTIVHRVRRTLWNDTWFVGGVCIDPRQDTDVWVRTRQTSEVNVTFVVQATAGEDFERTH